MSDTAIVGIDLGTSSIRSLLTTTGDRMVGKGQPSSPTFHPGLLQDEQRPDDWWQAAASAVAKARRFASDTKVTGHMPGTVTPDAEGEPLGAAIIWSDQRTSSLAGPVSRQLDIDQAVMASPILHNPVVCANRLHLFREATSTMLPSIQGLDQP